MQVAQKANDGSGGETLAFTQKEPPPPSTLRRSLSWKGSRKSASRPVWRMFPTWRRLTWLLIYASPTFIEQLYPDDLNDVHMQKLTFRLHPALKLSPAVLQLQSAI